MSPAGIAATIAADRPFSASQALALRYRFVESPELKKALDQFCSDLGITDTSSVAQMSQNRVHYMSLQAFWKARQYFKPDPERDAIGRAAADFMAAETIASLFEVGASVDGASIAVPLVKTVMERGADGLFKVGEDQFDELGQMAVDLVDWLERGKFKSIVLVEAPLGNSVPVAVIHALALRKGLKAEIVEWACPRNDRASRGRTVLDSAKDLAADPLIQTADMVVFVDDAITGSRFLKMAEALRKAIGNTRVASIAIRVRYNPKANFEVSPVRELDKVAEWAKTLALPYGVRVFPDLPLFKFDSDGPTLFESALAWGDASLTAGKRKANLVFYFLDRFEAIARQLGEPGPSAARDFLIERLWQRDILGRQMMILPSVARSTFMNCIRPLPPSFFTDIRAAAEAAFPGDFHGQRVTGVPEVRRRTDWLADCVFQEAVKTLRRDMAHVLNNAIQDLSNAGFDAGVSKPTRDHNYGQGTFPLPPGEDALHLRLVDLIVTAAATKTPCP